MAEYIKNKLNPVLWEDNKLNHDINDKLKTIALNFFDDLDLDIKLIDIHLTGSNVNYQWQSDSDLDVHLVVDFCEDAELKFKLADYARLLWNSKHDITIKSFPVELYVEDYKTPATADGIWSIMHEQYLKKPSKPDAESEDDDEIYEIYVNWRKRIIELENKVDDNKDLSQTLKDVDKLKKELKNTRQSALTKGGIYTSENLAYKKLRTTGYLGRLIDLGTTIYDKIYTIESKKYRK